MKYIIVILAALILAACDDSVVCTNEGKIVLIESKHNSERKFESQVCSVNPDGSFVVRKK